MGSDHLKQQGGRLVQSVKLSTEAAVAVRIAISGSDTGRVNREEVNKYVSDFILHHINVDTKKIEHGLRRRETLARGNHLRRSRKGAALRKTITIYRTPPDTKKEQLQILFSAHVWRDLWHKPVRVDVQVLDERLVFFPITNRASNDGYKVSGAERKLITVNPLIGVPFITAGRHVLEYIDGLWCLGGLYSPD